MVPDVENVYGIWKPEQHILTSKYNIRHWYVPLVKYFHVACVNNAKNPFKIIRKRYNRYAKCAIAFKEII